ncbi:uncharacterized protein J3R85_000302 [Psidium guajava]|nr:uncharacterized protein J3R85_000302 [Psidium guajava]
MAIPSDSLRPSSLHGRCHCRHRHSYVFSFSFVSLDPPQCLTLKTCIYIDEPLPNSGKQDSYCRGGCGEFLFGKDENCGKLTIEVQQLEVPKDAFNGVERSRRAWRRWTRPRDACYSVVPGFVDTGINPAHPSFANVRLPPLNGTSRFFDSVRRTNPQLLAILCNGR